MLSKKYKQRGKSNRIRKVGGWAALVERQIIKELSKSISKEIDKEILRRLQEYAKTNIHN